MCAVYVMCTVEMNPKILYLVLFLFLYIANCNSICSNKYGSEPCSYLPALPGKTPPCAQPGFTYCEHPEHYPGQRIQYLIQKWRFDHSTILKDESREEFSSYFYPSSNTNKYANYGPNNNIQHTDSYLPEPIYIPKPDDYRYNPFLGQGNTYIPPASVQNFSSGFAGYPDRRQPYQFNDGQYHEQYKYSSTPNYQGDVYSQLQNAQSFLGLPNSYPYNKVWNRKDDNDKYEKLALLRMRRSERVKRNLKKLRSLEASSNHNTSSSAIFHREKRQSALAGQTLCQSRSQFIMPRAALNNRGNWMYIVNMPELDQRYTQLVKSETCLSQTCSGLCSLPTGYTSRCEQKYVQKRLVALEGGGNELYNDVFWFPSCCVCTLSNS